MKRTIFILFLAVCIFVAAFALAACEYKVATTSRDTTGSVSTSEGSDADITIDLNAVYFAEIDIEEYGRITVEFDSSAAPITVDNFVTLAESGFYDGLTFHRIM